MPDSCHALDAASRQQLADMQQMSHHISHPVQLQDAFDKLAGFRLDAATVCEDESGPELQEFQV